MRTDWQKLMPLLPTAAVLPILQELQKLDGDLAQEVCWALRCHILQRAVIKFHHTPQMTVFARVMKIYDDYHVPQ